MGIVERRVRLKFWSAQCRSAGPLGGRRESRGTWDWEELTLLLPVLTRTRWDAALAHSVAVT